MVDVENRLIFAHPRTQSSSNEIKALD
uniref:Uncharacterized protein n=1 Tax=Arundo donax TaxID=35708 RepID=A0A0A8YRH6_ARUDO